MAYSEVKRGENPQEKVVDGDVTYLLFPGVGVTAKATAGWSVLRIDATTATDVTIQWSGGNKIKKYVATTPSALTYSNILQ
jgi:hypothetical protein